MGTRSAIGYKTPEGKIRAKYSHYDGYPAYTGAMLEKHYQQARKIAQLVELGDASVLRDKLFGTANHSFDTPDGDVTVFYGRDRGETGVDAREFDTVQDFVDYYTSAGCEYFYLRAGDAWIYHDRYGVGKDDHGYPIMDILVYRAERDYDRIMKMVANSRANA